MVKVPIVSKVETYQAFKGRVVAGRKLGRTLGFPTANLDCDVRSLDNGVYGVMVNLHGKNYLGVMNIGVKPTVKTDLRRTMEIHLLDFQANLYGETLRCKVIFKIREERKFKSLASLIQQIKEDVLIAQKGFKHIGFSRANQKNQST